MVWLCCVSGWQVANLGVFLSPQMNKAIVYIEELDSVADVTFPAIPQVVSLFLYDNTDKIKDRPHPPNGYPVVCVTVSVYSSPGPTPTSRLL